MDEFLKRARKHYASLVANDQTSKTVTAGRYAQDADKESAIWDDVYAKLGLAQARPGARVLDIGCGISNVTDRLIELVRDKNLSATLVDFPEVIDALSRSLRPNAERDKLKLISGTFPYEMPAEFLKTERFDFILMYSVLHCTGQPYDLLHAAAGLLAPAGRLLAGDLANVNRKGRFLASEAGRAFDARYKGVPIESIPVYKSHQEFVAAKKTGNNAVNDDFVGKAFVELRAAGFDVFVLPQPESLPQCYTREDLLVTRY